MPAQFWRRTWFQVHNLANADGLQEVPYPARDGLGVLEGEDCRANQVHGPSSMDEPAPSRDEHVLEPVDVAPVGESDQKPLAMRERVDGCPMETSAGTTSMEYDAEVGKPPGARSKRGVGHAAVQPGEPLRKRHSIKGTGYCLPSHA